MPPEDHKEASEDEVVHEDNDWGISLVDESVPDAAAATSSNQGLTSGVTLAYERQKTIEADKKFEQPAEAEDDVSVEELMKQMKQL